MKIEFREKWLRIEMEISEVWLFKTTDGRYLIKNAKGECILTEKNSHVSINEKNLFINWEFEGHLRRLVVVYDIIHNCT